MRFAHLLLLAATITSMAQAEPRVFVSLAGSLLEADITTATADTVTLKRTDDQQTLTISRRTLCKEDNAYISRWQEQNGALSAGAAPAPIPVPASGPVQKYRIVCQTMPAKSARSTNNSDSRTTEITYSFNLSNQEVKRDLENARGLAITLGRNLGDSSGSLIVLQKVEFELNIRAQSKIVYTTPPVRLFYSVDPDAPYGVKSYGYVLIIRDAAGNILLTEASPDASARYIKDILALEQVPSVVSREFRALPRSRVPLEHISF